MPITTALITAAGFGTRFLPITKTLQKEMLPILDRPMIDYVVDDLVAAGVSHIIFVISEHNDQLVHFYRENKRLEEYLKKMGKSQLYSQVAHLHEKAKISFVRQPDDAVYGTATPVQLAQHLLEDQSAFFVFMGDDFLFDKSGQTPRSEAAAMARLFEESGAAGLVTCIPKAKSEISRYGVAELRSQNSYQFLEAMVEKPQPADAPSNLVNISKYILTPAIFPIIQAQAPNASNGELYITDSVTTLAQQQDVVVYQPSGEYLDGGHLAGWLQANLTVAWQKPELREIIKKTLDQLESGV